MSLDVYLFLVHFHEMSLVLIKSVKINILVEVQSIFEPKVSRTMKAKELFLEY